MIKSCLGEVQLTRPDYKLCEILSISKEDVDHVVDAGLKADLTSILGALADIYGDEKALEMWTKSAAVFIEVKKGDTTQ
ncbi:MAG: hypothetical protein J6F30_08845 [Cellulosilyticum sp.]|nr:hypothetical protein [Cellulosilyticum sp.]